MKEEDAYRAYSEDNDEGADGVTAEYDNGRVHENGVSYNIKQSQLRTL